MNCQEKEFKINKKEQCPLHSVFCYSTETQWNVISGGSSAKSSRQGWMWFCIRKAITETVCRGGLFIYFF